MRTRNRSIVRLTKNWGGAGIQYSGIPAYVESFFNNTRTSVGQYNHIGYSVPVDYTDERITDELGKDHPHECHHRKQDTVINTATGPYKLPMSYGAGGYDWYESSDPKWIWLYDLRMPDYNWDLTNILVNPPFWSIDRSFIDEVNLKNDCIDKAKGLKADLLLDIVEANQIWPSITSVANCLPAIARNWKQLRKCIKTASDGFLAWKFGVSPLLSDFKAIHRYTGKLNEDIRRHARSQLQTVSTQAEALMVCNESPRVLESYNGISKTVVTHKGSLIKRPVVRFVLSVKPRVQYESKLFNSLDTLLSRFATSPADLAWEKVPFSFVVDWFVDLRGMARLVDNCLGFEPYTVVSFTKSFSYEVETAVSNTFKDTSNGLVLSNNWCGTRSYKHYERYPVSYNDYSLSWRRRFGKSQAAVSAALISQRLNRLGAK